MLMVVSPAKNLDFGSQAPVSSFTQPELLDYATELANQCKELSPSDLSSLMKISDKLAILNAERFNSFSTPFSLDNAKQALFAFNGDVYSGLDASSLTDEDIKFAQAHLRILSGLYGVLRPLDLMQAYRLEMGTKFQNTKGKNLYEFWDQLITQKLNDEMSTLGTDSLVNLASNEYFDAVKKKTLNASIITPVFKDEKNGKYKIISFYAKKARGLMARFIIQNKITDVEGLKGFDSSGYSFCASESDSSTLTFKRSEATAASLKS